MKTICNTKSIEKKVVHLLTDFINIKPKLEGLNLSQLGLD